MTPDRALAPAIDQAAVFFASLYKGQSGILELRTVPLADTWAERRIASRLRAFVPVTDGRFDSTQIATFVKSTSERKMAAYFGVALRTPRAAIDRRGSAPYCQTLTALFVDADFKLLGEAETRRRLAEFPIPPSIRVNSGGGLHAYWVLRTPLDLSARHYPEAQSILRRLAKHIGGVVDEAVSEPARVLRIPGSLNFKRQYGEPRSVVLEHV